MNIEEREAALLRGHYFHVVRFSAMPETHPPVNVALLVFSKTERPKLLTETTQYMFQCIFPSYPIELLKITVNGIINYLSDHPELMESKEEVCLSPGLMLSPKHEYREGMDQDGFRRLCENYLLPYGLDDKEEVEAKAEAQDASA